MKMNLIKVLIIAMSLIMCATLIVPNIIFADDAASYSTAMKGLLTEADGSDGLGAGDSTTASASVRTVMGTIMTVIRIIAMTIAIVMLLTIAMKYMLASPGEKADMKKSMVAYVVGAVVLFAATGLLSIIEKFSAVISTSTTTTPVDG